MSFLSAGFSRPGLVDFGASNLSGDNAVVVPLPFRRGMEVSLC